MSRLKSASFESSLTVSKSVLHLFGTLKTCVTVRRYGQRLADFGKSAFLNNGGGRQRQVTTTASSREFMAVEYNGMVSGMEDNLRGV